MTGEVWVFGDTWALEHDRGALGLVAKGKDLARSLNTSCAVILLGWQTQPIQMEFIAHGAEKLYVMDAPHLAHLRARLCTDALCIMAKRFAPEIILFQANDTGRELASRVAQRLGTGLSANCVGLEIDPDTRRLVCLAPAFGGRLLAETVCPKKRPQMATVTPGVFKELPHNSKETAPVLYLEAVKDTGEPEVEYLSMEPVGEQEEPWHQAPVVVSIGLGVAKKELFDMAKELAGLLGAKLAGTRPMVEKGLIPPEAMIGQTGTSVKPKVLLTVGTSGALQYCASIRESQFIVAIDRDPNAPIFKEADLGIVADAGDILPLLLKALEGMDVKGQRLEVAYG